MTSSKKLIVAALACLPAFAFAQAEGAKAAEAKPLTAALYGTLNVNLQTTRQQGVAARDVLSTDSSNIGVKGAAELRYGLGATFQCETAADISGINIKAICNRNSRVGLTSPYGTLFYGNWDTPMKAGAYGTKADDPFGNTDVYAYQGILSSPGFNYRSGAFVGAGGATVGGFDIRAQDSVAYWSPKVQGVSLKAQWSVDEFKDKTGIIVPQLFGVVANFDQGPISVYASFEDHEDAGGLATINKAATATAAAAPAFGATAANPATKSARDWAFRAGAGVDLPSPFGVTTVSGAFDYIKFTQDSAAASSIKDYSRPAWQVAAKHRLKDHELRARFSQALNGSCTGVGFTCKTDGYGAHMLALGYAYYVAKSTQVYVHFAQITNKVNGQYTLSIGGDAEQIAGKTPKGADPRALGLGIRMAF